MRYGTNYLILWMRLEGKGATWLCKIYADFSFVARLHLFHYRLSVRFCDSCVKWLTHLQCEHELLHYLVALPFGAASPAAVSAGIEAWTWVIAEKPNMEIALMGEILSAWSDTIKEEKGIFSRTLKYYTVLSSKNRFLIRLQLWRPIFLPDRL